MNSKLNQTQDWLEVAIKANWSVAKVAKLCGVSVRSLELYFLKTKGKTPRTWLSEQRQIKGIELLRKGTSVKETAADLNYKYAQHFSRDFKRMLGYCPTQINRSKTTVPFRILV